MSTISETEYKLLQKQIEELRRVRNYAIMALIPIIFGLIGTIIVQYADIQSRLDVLQEKDRIQDQRLFRVEEVTIAGCIECKKMMEELQ